MLSNICDGCISTGPHPTFGSQQGGSSVENPRTMGAIEINQFNGISKSVTLNLQKKLFFFVSFSTGWGKRLLRRRLRKNGIVANLFVFYSNKSHNAVFLRKNHSFWDVISLTRQIFFLHFSHLKSFHLHQHFYWFNF